MQDEEQKNSSVNEDEEEEKIEEESPDVVVEDNVDDLDDEDNFSDIDDYNLVPYISSQKNPIIPLLNLQGKNTFFSEPEPPKMAMKMPPIKLNVEKKEEQIAKPEEQEKQPEKEKTESHNKTAETKTTNNEIIINTTTNNKVDTNNKIVNNNDKLTSENKEKVQSINKPPSLEQLKNSGSIPKVHSPKYSDRKDSKSKINKETDNKTSFFKIQLAFENILKKKYLMYYKRMSAEKFHSQSDLTNSKLFYYKERNSRLLYYDAELQSLIISLIMCLILTPSRGTFEETYCCSQPYEDNKINILFILHHHVNHPDNQHIIYLLLKLVSDIHPFGCGQRLLKLLVTNLFDSSIYGGWKKIGIGTYGRVYECSTSIAEPSIVAIKKMSISENIFDKCILFDIFTEITALESFRLEGCVTQLYDYGVDHESYYIVMKRYPNSLRQWRLNQIKPLEDMLSIYLNIFKDILKTLQIIHEKYTTHYDLKCDNVVIEGQNYSDGFEIGERGDICVKIADFGECK